MLKLNYWSSIKLSKKNVFQINHKKLNSKHKFLTRSYNTFCKANYIDYNCLVDQIIKMSQAYINNEKILENENNISHKSEFDLENLIRNGNLRKMNIFKTNTQIIKNNDNLQNNNIKTIHINNMKKNCIKKLYGIKEGI
jgi:hypothetical protein